MMIPTDDLKDPKSDYFKEALAWQTEKYELSLKQRRIGWIVSFVFIGVAVIEAFALMALTPFKTVEPYVIEVNTTTGETQVKRALKEGALTQSEALTKYWIIKTVRARVGYDAQDLEKQYEAVQMMSDRKEFARYNKEFNPKNPTSPYQIYGDKVTIGVRVKSVSFIDKDTALVRIDTIEKRRGGGIDDPMPWTVTLSYQFTFEPRTEAERFENPLGFQVTKWRMDAEVETGEE